jgi:hypothetical protein
MKQQWKRRNERPWDQNLDDDAAYRAGTLDALEREFGPRRDTESERCLADIERRGGMFSEQMGGG